MLEGLGYYYMQGNDAEVDIPTLVLRVKCKPSDLLTNILVSETKASVPAL